MLRFQKYFQIPYLIGFLTTAVYCVLVWYMGNAFTILSQQEGVSLFTRLTTMPLELPFYFNMVHWQILAGISFIFSLGTYQARQAPAHVASKPHPLLNHYGILFLCILLNLTGFAHAVLDVAYTIG